MPESRLERTRRAYDRVIDMGPYGCKLLMVGEPDNRALNLVWRRPSENAAEQITRKADWNDLERGEH